MPNLRGVHTHDSVAKDLLHRIARLRIDKSNGGRQPHKPLLMLIAIQHWVVNGERELPYCVVDQELPPLLLLHAPPKSTKPSPEMPYQHLQSDGVWEIIDADQLERRMKGTFTKAALQRSVGRISEPYATALASDPLLAAQAVQLLLDKYFAPSLHADLRSTIGLDELTFAAPSLAVAGDVAEAGSTSPSPSKTKKPRPPSFRSEVLAAYDHRCAVTGYQALLAGTPFCLEAAHVHSHSAGGPSKVSNGLALTPTLHKLFDYGAWTLDDERRVLVSSRFSGSDVALTELRGLHGKPIRKPVPGADEVSLEFVRWHREEVRGGVFKHPALPAPK